MNFTTHVARRLLLANVLCLVLAALHLCSCTADKHLAYFQHADRADVKQLSELALSNPAPLRIQANDMLAIVVSSLSEETNVLFNTPNAKMVNTPQFSSGGAGGSQPMGYLVDAVGEVSVPLLGGVRVAGMTIQEANTYLAAQLNEYVKSPTVNVRVLNHKFTVIGEVTRPGIYNLSDNATTLPEVIGLAGDLTIYGQRNSVKLIRTVNNKRELIELDLTSQQLLNSPYYFIENNDVVYVSARSGKAFASERSVQLLPIGIALVSTLAVLVNIFVR